MKHIATSYDANTAEVTEDHIQSILTEINAICPNITLGLDQVLWLYSGRLPCKARLINTRTVALVKHSEEIDHAKLGSPDGLLSTLGVKWRTARFVAKKAANIISADTPVIYAQLIYAARNEMVITLEDW